MKIFQLSDLKINLHTLALESISYDICEAAVAGDTKVRARISGKVAAELVETLRGLGYTAHLDSEEPQPVHYLTVSGWS